MCFCNVLLDLLCKMFLFKRHFPLTQWFSVSLSFPNLISSLEDGVIFPFLSTSEFLWGLNKMIMWKIFKKYKRLEMLSTLIVVLFPCIANHFWSPCTGGLGSAAMLVCFIFEKSLTNISHVIQIGLRKWSGDVQVVLKPDHGNKSFNGA